MAGEVFFVQLPLTGSGSLGQNVPVAVKHLLLRLVSVVRQRRHRTRQKSGSKPQDVVALSELAVNSERETGSEEDCKHSSVPAENFCRFVPPFGEECCHTSVYAVQLVDLSLRDVSQQLASVDFVNLSVSVTQLHRRPPRGEYVLLQV